MKLKTLICLLFVAACFCLLLCGCGKTAETATQDATATAETAVTSGTAEPKPALQLSSGAGTGDYANMTYGLTENSFPDFFHFRFESTDRGGEYDILSYSLALNADSAKIPAFIEGIYVDVSFDVEIKYAKEYKDGEIIYDTLVYPFCVSGRSGDLSGSADIDVIPVFKRSETDTEHKKFTVMNVTPHIASVAGKISYSSTNHTYGEAVTYDTAPGFEIVADDNCIAVYMMPGNDGYMYEDLAVEIELRYTDDTSGRPDQFVMYKEGRATIEGNRGGYGQYFCKVENGNVSKVVVSVVGVSGSVIKPKGYTVNYPAK